jgi:hypothetical protein
MDTLIKLQSKPRASIKNAKDKKQHQPALPVPLRDQLQFKIGASKPGFLHGQPPAWVPHERFNRLGLLHPNPNQTKTKNTLTVPLASASKPLVFNHYLATDYGGG